MCIPRWLDLETIQNLAALKVKQGRNGDAAELLAEYNKRIAE